MAIVQWDSSRDLSLLQGDMNRLFERFFGPGTSESRTQRWVPPMDVMEEGDHFVLKADLPGIPGCVVDLHPAGCQLGAQVVVAGCGRHRRARNVRRRRALARHLSAQQLQRRAMG